MAKIPVAADALKEVAPNNVRPLVQANAAAFGAQGRAMQDFAQTAGRAIAQISDVQERESEYGLATKLIDMDLAQEQAFEEAQRNAPIDPKGFAAGFRKQYDETARGFFKDVPDSLRPKYDEILARRGAQFESKARDFEYRARDEFVTGDLAKRIVDLSSLSVARPDGYRDNIARSQALIDAAPLPATTKMKLRQKAANDIEFSAYRARIDRGEDIDQVLMELNGGPEPLDADANPEARAKPFDGAAPDPRPAQPARSSDVARALISTQLETGKKDPLEGVSSIARDSAGSRSYGNFGLNSGGSAQRFVREYGQGLGLEGEPGTPAFDKSWRAAAARDPKALHDAEMAWYSQNVTANVGKRLINAGVSEPLANDPRVIAYFADRSIQQGNGSIDEMTKHKRRISAAAASANGDPVTFLKSVTEADREALESDFPTALRTGVYSERGHDNRLDGRLRLALGVEGSAETQSGPAYAGPARHLSADQRLDLMNTARAAQKRQAAMVMEDVRSVETIAEKGYAPPSDQLEALRSRVEKVSNPEVKQTFRQAEAIMQWQAEAKKLTPEQLDGYIRSETDRVQAGGANAFDVKRLEMADKLLGNMRSELKSDALGWADRVGLIKVAPIDFSAPETAQASLAARVQQADAVAQRYGVEPKYLRPDEEQRLSRAMDAGGDQTLQAAGMIATAAGAKTPAILAQVSKQAPTAAIIGGHVADNGVTAVARDAAEGLSLSKQPEFKSVAPPPKEIRAQISEVMGNALSGMPKTETAIVDAANKVYEIRARKMGLSGSNAETWLQGQELWKQGLKELIGERDIDNKTYGGVVDANPSYWGTRKVIIPPFLSQDNWRDAVDMIQPMDLESAGLGVPAGGDGKPIALSRVKGATLVQTGDGRYAFSLGDPDVPGEEKWVVRQDAPGELFEVDLRQLRPALSKRRPDLFVGSFDVDANPETRARP